MEQRKTLMTNISFVILIFFALIFIFPVFIVLMNSFKGRFFIADTPFQLLNSDTFVGFDNYVAGINKTNFFSAFGYTFCITVFSVFLIIIFDSMAAWYITRVNSAYSRWLYYILVFSMVVPFQMVMFTMAKTANFLHIDNLIGIPLIYLGFGSGLSVFMYSGFVKSIPLEIEESAMIDGCNPLQVFNFVVFPVLKPISVTVAILNTMWIWNDYLLPFLVIGNKYRTLSIAVQYLRGGYGSRDMGAMMAVLVMTIVPVIVFYLTCQKYIIRGIVAGAVKG